MSELILDEKSIAKEDNGKTAKPMGQWGIAWKRFKKNRVALVGLFVEGAILFIAIFAPFVAPYPPNDISAFYEGRTREPPSWDHLMGTDYTGHDVFSQVIYGASTAVKVGFGATLVSMTIAILIASTVIK